MRDARGVGYWMILAAGCATVGVAPGSVSAEEWAIVGSRYQAMGGAGVAIVDDVHAAYWNPGALGLATRTYEVDAPFRFSAAAEGDIIEKADAVFDFIDDNNFQAVLTKVRSGQTLSSTELQQSLSLVASRLPTLGADGQGLVASGDAGLVFRRGRLTISTRGMGFVGADPVVDLSRLSFSTAASGAAQVTNVVGAGNDRSAQFANASSQGLADTIASSIAAFSQNQAEELVYQAEQAGINTGDAALRSLITNIASATGTTGSSDISADGTGVTVSGLITEEVGVAYGHPFFGETLGVGVQLRYLRGTSIYDFVQYDDVDSSGDLRDDIDSSDNRRKSTRLGIDLGLMLRPSDRLRLGVTARNVNAPEFSSVGPDSVELQPQVRAGIAYAVTPGWLLAADVDLTENDSETVSGLDSRMVSVGTEYRLGGNRLGAVLRAGARANVASGSDRNTAITAGIGFQLWKVRLEFAGEYGLEREKISDSGSNIPTRLSAGLSLRWESKID